MLATCISDLGPSSCKEGSYLGKEVRKRINSSQEGIRIRAGTQRTLEWTGKLAALEGGKPETPVKADREAHSSERRLVLRNKMGFGTREGQLMDYLK